MRLPLIDARFVALLASLCLGFATLPLQAGTPPHVLDTLPLPESTVRNLTTVELFFSDDVTGVDASDLLVNGVPATDVTSFGANQYVFTFPAPAPGLVSISWTADHGIRDLSADATPFTAIPWSYLYDPAALLDAPFISEFMCDNDKTLHDEDGDSSDWIEIFNPSEDPLDLTGWLLSNDALNTERWRFPPVTVDPKSFLVLFASEKNRTNTGAKLHTNFKLSSNGGFLALSDPASNIVSSFTYPAQRKDVSYGREQSASVTGGFFTKPTPGSANVVGGPGFAPVVHFSRRSGTFVGEFDLVLSTDSPAAAIYYSIANGKNLPTESSNLYTGPIHITNTTHVRARAFLPAMLPGEPRSESFIVLSGQVTNVTSDLPLVILHNYGGKNVPASGEQFVMMQIFEPRNGVASLTNAPDLSERARFRRRGSSTEGYAKSSFALETWDEFNNDKKVSVLGMPEESDWNFYAPNNFEPVLIHNPFMYQLSRDIGRYASRTRFVEVYLNTLGGAVSTNNYFGIYVIEEKIKRGPNRVDVDKLEPEHLSVPEVTGGYMLKIDRPDPGDSPFSAAGVDWNYVDPKGPVIRTLARDPQEQYIGGYMRQLGNVLSNAKLWKDPVEGYAKYIDVDASIDHHILNVLAFNVDALRLSTYLYKPRNGKLTWGPIWDFDRALGSTDGRDANPKTWGDTGGTSFFQYPIWSRIFSDPDGWQKWIDRWEDLRLNQLSTSYINRLIDELTSQVRNAQPREYAKWRSLAPVRGSYQNEINLMKNYLQNRTQYIDSQLVRPPVPSVTGGGQYPGGLFPRGGTVSLAGTNVIYYTLSGVDPRLAGGGISPEAMIYTGPITINDNARLLARSYKPGHTGGPTLSARSPWSGLVTGTYVVRTPKLLVTEIMYHPSATAGLTNDPSDFEFVELKNASDTSLELKGFSFTHGVEFTFSSGWLGPGGRTVVVRNRGAFESRYGTHTPVAGEFSGSLDNAGEHLVLRGPLGETVADFHYDKGWYPITDGHGFSLVLRDEAVFPVSYEAASWRPSSSMNGSPGQAETAAPAFPAVYVNEVLSHPKSTELDKVEVFNAAEVPAQIGGWFLTDDFSRPRKFRIPDGTIIPGRGYLVFDESHFKPGPDGFSFSASGDETYIFSADAGGELTGYMNGARFGTAAVGVPFARWVGKDGRDHLVAESTATFGGPNALPASGPVIISEVMYQPVAAGVYDNTLDEFIELRNVSAAPVILAEGENGWRLRGGTAFDFPDGALIAAGGFALVVSFDPASSLRQKFADHFALPSDVPIFGPFKGKLNNSGDTIQLLRPEFGTPENDSYILVDSVGFRTELPWPASANGTGQSLQRLESFGDDPFSWIAALPSAGRETSEIDPDRDRDGLPDAWEVQWGLDPSDSQGKNGAKGDPDQDGLNNLQEYLAGTDPLSAASALHLSASRLVKGTRLSFSAIAHHSYAILFKSQLSDQVWSKLVDFPAPQEDHQQEFNDDFSGGVRFYRIVTSQR